jgi:MSHA biogenesis protein MshO
MRLNRLAQGPFLNQQTGLTLVELVVTIVLMGILAGGTVAYVVSSTQSYVDTATRNQLSAIARLTTTRLELEIGNAVPNSIRVTTPSSGNQCVEFFPIEDATRYISVNFNSAATSLTVKPFGKGGTLTGKKFPVIFPVDASELFAQPSPGPIGAITNYSQSVTGDVETLTLDSSHQFEPGTNRQRVYLAGEPVSFCVEGQKMYRYKGYGVKSAQCTPDTASCLPTTPPNRAVVSDQIVNASYTAFEYVAANLQRNGLVRLNLNFSDGNESLLIQHEIQLNNAP